MGRTSLLLVGLCVLAGAAWFWHERSGVSSGAPVSVDGSNAVVTEVLSGASQVLENTSTKSPFAVDNTATNSDTPSASSEQVGDALDDSAGAFENQDTANIDQAAYSLDVATLGHSTLSDDELLQLIDALRGDSALLQQLIDEFRQETNVERRIALSRLLGEVGGDDVTLTASELIYSGDVESRRLGLELLQQIQPGNANARDIASSLLATEIEPTILVGL